MLKKNDDDAGIRTMKSEMLTSLECRFNYIQQIEKLCVATILDPRFKHHFFTGTETQKLTRQYVIDNCEYITGIDEPPNKNHGMIITSPLLGAIIRHRQTKYGSALLNCQKKLGQLVIWAEDLKLC